MRFGQVPSRAAVRGCLPEKVSVDPLQSSAWSSWVGPSILLLLFPSCMFLGKPREGPHTQTSMFLIPPSPLAHGSALSMTERVLATRHKSLSVSHPGNVFITVHTLFLGACMSFMGWHPLLPPQGAGCLNNTSFSCPMKPAGQDSHYSLPLNQLQCLATSVSFKDFSWITSQKCPFISKAIVSWAMEVGSHDSCYFSMGIQGLSSFSLLLTSQDPSISRRTTFIPAFFIMWSRLLSHQMLSSRNYLSFLGPAMLIHILVAFLKFASELPRPLLFLHCHVPIVTLSSYFYLFNGCLTWHFCIRLSLVWRKIAPVSSGALLGPFLKGCLGCFFLSLFHKG